MKKDSFQKDNSLKYYSMNEFLQDLKKLSVNDNADNKAINPFNSLNLLDTEFQKKKFQTPIHYKSEMRNQLNEKLKSLDQSPGGYINEVMKSELSNLAKENAELKFCLNNLNKKFEKEIKDLKLQNEKKSKEIQST
jgi:hypothetical protein